MIEVVAFAGTLTHAGEHGVTAVRLGDVVDEFLDEHGLAHAGAAEEADLAALGVRREKVHDLDAGDEDFGFRRLLGEFRCGGVDRTAGLGLHRACLVDRLADHVHDAAEGFVTHRNGDGRARVLHGLAAHEAFGRVHGDGAHGVLAEVLRHFEDQAVAAVVRFEGVENFRKRAVKGHVDDGTSDLRDAAGGTGGG